MITFSDEKCELLKIKCKGNKHFIVNCENFEVVKVVRYLEDHINMEGENAYLCQERVNQAEVTIIILCTFSKGPNFGNRQNESILVWYKAVFLPY